MSSRRDIRRPPVKRRRWPRILGFAMLVLAAGALALYALSQSSNAGAAAPSPSESSPVVRHTPQIDILGDSYVGGSAEGGRGGANWTRLVGTRFYEAGAQVELNVMAQPGSGYIARGTTGLVFREAATQRLRPSSDVVVVFGSRNDGRQTEQAMYEASRLLYADIHRIAPQAQVVVIGPVWVDANVPDFIVANNAAMARAAEQENVTYIDAIAGGWFAEGGQDLIGADGIHPTDAGHSYLASKIFPLVQEAIGNPEPGA